MPTTSFKEGVSAIAEAETAEAKTEVVVQTADTQIAQTGPRPMDDFEGEIDKSDLQMPKLNIAQSIGPLSDDFPAGTVVLNKKLVLADKGQRLTIIPVKAVKYFQEDLEYGGDDIPRKFKTVSEAKAAGLRVEFDNETGLKPEVKACLDLSLLIRGGEIQAPEFCFEHAGDKYAFALWQITSWSAYQNAAAKLLTARSMYLTSFNEREWTLYTDKKKMKNGNSTFIPVLDAGQRTTPEFRNWSQNIL